MGLTYIKKTTPPSAECAASAPALLLLLHGTGADEHNLLPLIDIVVPPNVVVALAARAAQHAIWRLPLVLGLLVRARSGGAALRNRRVVRRGVRLHRGGAVDARHRPRAARRARGPPSARAPPARGGACSAAAASRVLPRSVCVCDIPPPPPPQPPCNLLCVSRAEMSDGQVRVHGVAAMASVTPCLVRVRVGVRVAFGVTD